MYTIKYSQWLSRLDSKRNVVGADRIVGKIFFSFWKSSLIRRSSKFNHTPSQYPVYQGNGIYFKDTTNSKVIFIYRYVRSPDILS